MKMIMCMWAKVADVFLMTRSVTSAKIIENHRLSKIGAVYYTSRNRMVTYMYLRQAW